MQPVIRVEMLGGLSVWAGGRPVLARAGKINKPWQVFCYLVLNRTSPTPPAKLIGEIWPEENLIDPNNVLKNTIYALRREFKNAAEGFVNPILFENGGYICNPEIACQVDAEEFETLMNQDQDARGEGRIALQQQATALYKGNLLPQLAADKWVAGRDAYYRKLHGECVNQLCAALYEQGRYVELLAEAQAACRIDVLEQNFYLHLFHALYRLHMYHYMIPLYQRISRTFADELGVNLRDELRELYASACEKMNPIEQDIMIIKDDLREVGYEHNFMDGALYCTYDVFKYLYQMVARTCERTGAHILILLVSVQELNGGHPHGANLNHAMNYLKDKLLGGLLRKSDTVSRYSKSQYIIMLTSEQLSGAEAVMNRLRQRCGPELERLGLRMVFTNTELDPANA